MPLATVAEIRKYKDGKMGWQPIEVAIAVRLTDDTFRCAECHAKVRPHRAGERHSEAHFEHHKGFSGCSLSDYFDGKKRANPDALEY